MIVKMLGILRLVVAALQAPTTQERASLSMRAHDALLALEVEECDT